MMSAHVANRIRLVSHETSNFVLGHRWASPLSRTRASRPMLELTERYRSEINSGPPRIHLRRGSVY
jgi:hypothetical protein